MEISRSFQAPLEGNWEWPRSNISREIQSINPRNLFPDERGIRPWLFGNWWILDKQNSQRQLIGLGVRLSTTARMGGAEGNTEKEVYFRGTDLRVRTNIGK
jgi:hypothetical protein